MSEWTVVTVIATLVGLCATVIRPLMNLNGAITRLTEVAKKLDRELRDMSEKNSLSHGKLWEAVSEQEESVNKHETRLAIIESVMLNTD